MKLNILSAIGTFMVMGVLSSSTFAQVDRQGFLIGFNAGASYIHDKDFLGDGENGNLGFGGEFYVGGSITPEFSLMGMYDFHAGVEKVQGEDVSVVNAFIGPVAQYSFLDRFWVRGGPGFVATRAESSIDVGNVRITVGSDRGGFGALVGAGVEVWQTGRFAMDVNFRTLPQWFKSEDGGFAINYAGGLGFTWY